MAVFNCSCFYHYFTGMMSTTVPMYLAECSPADIRGRLVATNVAMVACGQFVAGIVDGLFSANQKNGWR